MTDLDRFVALVDAYGGSPARWPEAERAMALALMKASPEAQRMAQEAEALDTLLDMPETAPATRALQDRILAAVAKYEPRLPKHLGIFSARPWLPAGAVACSLVLGIAVGTQLPGLVGIDEEAFAQDAVSSAMTASFNDSGLGDEE